LAELMPFLGPDLVAPLLSTLVDDPTGETQVFGIVHVAESITDPQYTAGLLKAMPVLIKRSPRWATILLIRALNSPETLRQLLQLVPDLPHEQRAALLDAAEAVERWRPGKFDEKTNLIRNGL